MPDAPRSALVLGATGLVGGHVLDLLLADAAWTRVLTLGRRPAARDNPKLEQRVVGFDRVEEHADAFAVDAVFCCLGTTIRAAGSQEEFRRVDHDYPVAAARLASGRGAPHFLLVTAMGADAGSRVFYNRVKGEVERDLLALNYPRTTIARPSLLLGEREEFRLGERVFERLGWLMPPAYKPIHARDVAAALVRAAHSQESGVQILESRAMRARRM
jgi:uncharacterized protein YbjT (DUF2867 family)